MLPYEIVLPGKPNSPSRHVHFNQPGGCGSGSGFDFNQPINVPNQPINVENGHCLPACLPASIRPKLTMLAKAVRVKGGKRTKQNEIKA